MPRRKPLSFVIAGHSRPKDGVASLAYDPAIHVATAHVADFFSGSALSAIIR
jgi:hypothetical protein